VVMVTIEVACDHRLYPLAFQANDAGSVSTTRLLNLLLVDGGIELHIRQSF